MYAKILCGTILVAVAVSLPDEANGEVDWANCMIRAAASLEMLAEVAAVSAEREPSGGGMDSAGTSPTGGAGNL